MFNFFKFFLHLSIQFAEVLLTSEFLAARQFIDYTTFNAFTTAFSQWIFFECTGLHRCCCYCVRALYVHTSFVVAEIILELIQD